MWGQRSKALVLFIPVRRFHDVRTLVVGVLQGVVLDGLSLVRALLHLHVVVGVEQVPLVIILRVVSERVLRVKLLHKDYFIREEIVEVGSAVLVILPDEDQLLVVFPRVGQHGSQSTKAIAEPVHGVAEQYLWWLFVLHGLCHQPAKQQLLILDGNVLEDVPWHTVGVMESSAQRQCEGINSLGFGSQIGHASRPLDSLQFVKVAIRHNIVRALLLDFWAPHRELLEHDAVVIRLHFNKLDTALGSLTVIVREVNDVLVVHRVPVELRIVRESAVHVLIVPAVGLDALVVSHNLPEVLLMNVHGAVQVYLILDLGVLVISRIEVLALFDRMGLCEVLRDGIITVQTDDPIVAGKLHANVECSRQHPIWLVIHSDELESLVLELVHDALQWGF
mmetsp:Transcript_12253/g.37373  ORF Transcript_12253/g.37373 Transcript_12253/m.37373 type:complete len:392 (-) Transcript_12253:1100-2275(-)